MKSLRNGCTVPDMDSIFTVVNFDQSNRCTCRNLGRLLLFIVFKRVRVRDRGDVWVRDRASVRVRVLYVTA